MGMRFFCAHAQKQVDKSKIYLAISSFYYNYNEVSMNLPSFLKPSDCGVDS